MDTQPVGVGDGCLADVEGEVEKDDGDDEEGAVLLLQTSAS
jgi:hypothetical protein